MKIGFDLDGVIINKPPFVPKRFIEWMVRSHKTKGLTYRYPASRTERFIRWLSHHPLFRPPIRKNAEIIRSLCKNRNCRLYVVSSRYKFLQDRTKLWFEKYGFDSVFEGVYINLDNKQPHLFKKSMIKKLKLDIFIDDDLPLVKYLKRNIKGVSIVSVEEQKNYLKDLTR